MKEIKIPMWRQELKAARKKEGKLPSSRWFQLCTINGNNEPRLRTVVFRGWQTESSILIFTDRRSEKVAQLKLNSNAEVLWLFFKSKSQFRFKGKMKELKEMAFMVMHQHPWFNEVYELKECQTLYKKAELFEVMFQYRIKK